MRMFFFPTRELAHPVAVLVSSQLSPLRSLPPSKSCTKMSVLNSLRRTIPSLTRSVHTSPPQSAVGAAVTVSSVTVQLWCDNKLTVAVCFHSQALLHGSQAARDEGEHAEKQHSKTVGRGVSYIKFASSYRRWSRSRRFGQPSMQFCRRIGRISRRNVLYWSLGSCGCRETGVLRRISASSLMMLLFLLFPEIRS